MSKKVYRDSSMYEDMLTMARPISTNRAPMAIGDRAAQFAPFAAVVGHEKAVKEATRYTESKRELDEMEKVLINEKLKTIDASLPHSPEVEILYFEPDSNKPGGAYETKQGTVKKIDALNQEIIMEDGKIITIEMIYTIDII